MQAIINDFNERVIEIEEYLKLLQLISQPTAKIQCEGRRAKAPSGVALKTMKASCFLMLYNLVESTIRGSMRVLYERMNSGNHSLTNLDACVKDLWLKQKFKNLDPFSSNQTSYRNLIKSIVDDVLQSTPITLNPKHLPISGNLDAQKIRDLFTLHKIPTRAHYRSLQGAELRTVKDKRNALAHGNESFASCGQQYTVQTIIDIKRQTVVFLRSSLKNVQKYIDDNQYAA